MSSRRQFARRLCPGIVLVVQSSAALSSAETRNSQVMIDEFICRIEGYNPENALDKKLDAFAEAARAIAREKNLPLVDLRQAFIDYWKKHNPDNQPKGFLTYDGNHWTEAGHQFVAQQMLKKFK